MEPRLVRSITGFFWETDKSQNEMHKYFNATIFFVTAHYGLTNLRVYFKGGDNDTKKPKRFMTIRDFFVLNACRIEE